MLRLDRHSWKKYLLWIVCTMPIVWIVSGLFFDLSLFSLRFPPIQIPNDLSLPFSAASYSYDTNRQIKEINFRFQPCDIARTFIVSFQSDHDNDQFMVIRISGIDDLPSTMMIVNRRTIVSKAIIDIPENGGAYDCRITIDNGLVRTIVNEGRPQAMNFSPVDRQMILSFYPTFPLIAINNPFKSIQRLSITTSSISGKTVTRRLLSERFRLISRAFLFMLFQAAAIVVFGYTASRRRNYLYWLGLTVLTVFLILAAMTCVHHPPSSEEKYMRASSDLPQWPKDFLRDNVFQKDLFAAASKFRVDARPIEILPNRDKVLVIGGSITYGEPYPPYLKNDYPSQIEAMLVARGFSNVQVINLGKSASSLLDYLIYLDGTLAVLKPAAVVISSISNEYLSGQNMRQIIAGFLGFHSKIGPPEDDEIESYQWRIEEFIRICKHYDVPVVLVEEPMDRYFFGYNPVLRYQQTLQTVAQKEQLPIVLLQNDYDRDQGRFLFYEFIHQTYLGYHFMATRIVNALSPILQTPRSPQVPGANPAAK